MNNNRRSTLLNTESHKWVNLAIVATLTFYILQISFFLINSTICGVLGSDYCAYWSAGRIINEQGFVDVYDLELLTQYQKAVYPHGAGEFFEPFGIMYLPIFLLPFKFLSLISPSLSYWVWTLINFVGFVFYIRFFTKEVTGSPLPGRLLLMILLSLPVFVNLREGQVNVWLLICAGEFIRASLSGKPIRAGLWLGGWLIKPQLLILILVLMLIKRSAKVLVGFLISTVLVLALSFALVNQTGFVTLINVIREASAGEVISNIPAMMNWRMLGWHISSLTSSTAGSAVAILGTIITIGLALYFFGKNGYQASHQKVIALLGIFAATGAVAIHSHFHTSLILIPPTIYLLMKDRFDEGLFFTWLFMPIGIELIIYILITLINLNILPTYFIDVTRLASGLRGLVLNLLIFGWAIFQYSRANETWIVQPD